MARSFLSALFLGVVMLFGATLVSCSSPMNIQVTLRGKRYDMSVSKVGEVQKHIEEKSGLKTGQQAVLFKGKVLSSEESLAEAGVAEGDTLNIIPQKQRARPAQRSSFTAPEKDIAAAASSAGKTAGGAGGMGDLLGGMGGLEALLGGAGGIPGLSNLGDLKNMSPEQLNEAAQQYENLLKNMSPEELAKVQETFNGMVYKLINSPMVQQLLNNDAALEEFRTSLVNNPEIQPMLKDEMKMVLEDEHRFRGAVKQVIEQYSNMPPPAADGDFFGGLGDLSGLKPKKGEDGVDDLPEDDSNEL